ncbi:MAG: DMT family transporter [Halobacteriaceae archaeon]
MKFQDAILFLILAIVWGSAFTAIKAGLTFFPPVLFAALRYDFAGILMLGYAMYINEHWMPSNYREWQLVGIGGALMIAAYHAFLFVGEQGTTSAAAAIIVSLSPILTTGFARILLPDERLTTVGIMGLGFGFLGVIILSNPDPNNIFDSRTVSMFLIFIATASFALGSVLTRRSNADLAIETMEAWAMIIGAILMHGISLAIGESWMAITWTQTALISLGYLVVIASAGGFLIYFSLLERLGPIEINLVAYAGPVAATITGFVFLNEIPTIYTMIGFVFIVIGFILIKRRAIRREFDKTIALL